MTSDRIIDEIKTRLDIVDIISEHVDLRKAGQNFKGLCPFHAEKTPSFMVNPSKQIFHCFGCGKGGDLVTFIMNHEMLTFPEALSYLARKAGVKLEEFPGGNPAQRVLKERLVAIHGTALDFYRRALRLSDPALHYLKQRDIDNGTAEVFGLGYSPKSREALLAHLREKGYSADDIRQSGLVHHGEHGPHDFFRDRLMFPILDLQGRPVAFGARLISPAKNAPKYLNSPDSPVFRKGETLYGLFQAKGPISQKGYSLIVEGYLDVVTCHRLGFCHTVAPLGTALTPGHLKKLKRFSPKVLLVFDGDAAGVAATRRSLELIFAEAMHAKVLVLPPGEDPDSFLRKEGAEPFRKFLSRAVSPVSFILGSFRRNKLDAVRHLLALLATCPDALLREETIKETADQSRMSEQLLREELAALMQRSRQRSERLASPAVTREKRSPMAAVPDREERLLLAVALSMPEMVRGILRSVDRVSFDNPLIHSLFEKIRQISSGKGVGDLSVEELLAQCSEEEQTLVTGLLMDTEINHETVAKTLTDCTRRMALRGLERQIASAEEKGDERRLQQLLREKSRLLSQRV